MTHPTRRSTDRTTAPLAAAHRAAPLALRAACTPRLERRDSATSTGGTPTAAVNTDAGEHGQRHADRVGPGGPRRAGRADRGAQHGVPGEVPEHHAQAGHRAPSTTSRRPSSSPCRATTPPTSSRPTTAAPTWARSSRPASSRRSTGTPTPTAGTTATPSRCASTRATPPTARPSATGNLYGLPAGRRGRRHLRQHRHARQGRAYEVPKTWADFETSLATLKSAGEQPLVLGNLDKWPAIHVFGTVQAQTAPADQIRTLGFGQEGASWTTPENTKAAQTLADWVDKGYFGKDVNGLGYDPAWQAFSKGTGAYLIAGTWLQADLGKAMGDDVTFVAAARRRPAKPVGDRWHRHPVGGLEQEQEPRRRSGVRRLHHQPGRDDDARRERQPAHRRHRRAEAPERPGAGRLHRRSAPPSRTTRLVPYLDYATPTMADTLGARCRTCWRRRRRRSSSSRPSRRTTAAS